MRLSINQVREEKEGVALGRYKGVTMLSSHSTPPPPHLLDGWCGGVGCVYGAVSHMGRLVPGDAGHQGDEKIIASSVRARGDKV